MALPTRTAWQLLGVGGPQQRGRKLWRGWKQLNRTGGVALSLRPMLSTIQQQRKRFKHELTRISHTTYTLILILAFPFCSEFVSILIKQTKIFQRFKEKKMKWEGQWEGKVFSLFLHVNKRFCLTSNLPKLIDVQKHQKLLTWKKTNKYCLKVTTAHPSKNMNTNRMTWDTDFK